MLEILASAVDEAGPDAYADVRRGHARRYLLLARPLVMLLGVIVTVVTVLTTPTLTHADDWAVLGFAMVLTVLGAVAALHLDPLRVATWSIPFDAMVVVAATVMSDHPNETAMLLLWPIIGTAYFGDWRAAMALTAVSAVACTLFGRMLEAWHDPAVLPSVAVAIAICGAFITFAMHQSRLAELRLARAHERDRRALQLSRRIHFAFTPEQALDDIAREVGVEMQADAVAVALLDLEEGYAIDTSVWRAATADDPPGRARIDTALCSLVARGDAVIVEDGEPRLVHRRDSASSDEPAAPAVRRALGQLLQSLGHDDGVLMPIALGNISIGLLVVAREGRGWQRPTFTALEPVLPQLAAGLAQAVLVRDQRETLESLERVDRMRDRLIANVSHELRTPLTSTLGFIETLMRDDVALEPVTRAELMSHAREGGRRLLALVEDLLALGTTRPESLDLAPLPLAAHELVDAALRDVELPSSRRLVTDVCPDARVVADRNRLLQVLTNLVVNAERHGGGTVEVRVRSEGETTTFDVIDDGPGVLPEHVHELFLPFARFSTRTDSTGLGLAICRTIVEAHGGTIRYSRVEGGRRTRFRVRLPAELAS